MMTLDNAPDLPSYTVSLIQDLIYINIDSSRGYKLMKLVVLCPKIALIFATFAEQRASFAIELQDHIESSYEQEVGNDSPPQSCNPSWWIEARMKIIDGGEHAVLSEIEHSEQHITVLYQQALVETKGHPINDVLRNHFEELLFGYYSIRELCDNQVDN